MAQMGVLPTKALWELDDATVHSALSFHLGISPDPSAHGFYQCTYGCQGSDAHHAVTCDKRSVLSTMRPNHVQSSVQYGATATCHSIESQPMGFAGLEFGY
jgi:hypothetical protein